MNQSETIKYVSIDEEGQRIAEYRIDYLGSPVSNYKNITPSAAIKNQREASIEGKKIAISHYFFDSTTNQIVVQITPENGTDSALFEIVFDLEISISDGKETTTTKEFENLRFENVVVNTPDMLLYEDEDKTVVTGPNNDDPRWDTCDALLIPKTVEKIGEKAFDMFGHPGFPTHVHWLILDETWNKQLDPNGCQLKEIGFRAFSGAACIWNGLWIPSTVEKIDAEAFAASGMGGGGRYTLHFVKEKGVSNLKTIGSYAFNQAGIDGEVNIPSSVELIYRSAFDWAQFTSLNFETKEDGTTSLVEIGADSFAGAVNLAGEINIPKGVKFY